MAPQLTHSLPSEKSSNISTGWEATQRISSLLMPRNQRPQKRWPPLQGVEDGPPRAATLSLTLPSPWRTGSKACPGEWTFHRRHHRHSRALPGCEKGKAGRQRPLAPGPSAASELGSHLTLSSTQDLLSLFFPFQN